VRRWLELSKIAALVIAVVVVARMAFRLRDVVGVVLLAVAFALLTAPVRRRIARVTGNGAATALTALLTFAVVVAIAGLVLRDLQGQADNVAADLTERIQALEPGSRSARLAEAVDAEDGIQHVLDALPPSLVAGEDDAMGVGRQTVDLLFVVILAAFLQSSAMTSLDWVVAHWPREQRLDVRRLVDDVIGRGLGYVRRSIVAVGVTALVVSAAAWAVGMPGPVLAGVWVGAWTVVPGLGVAMALAPLVAFAALASSGAGWATTFVAAVAVGGAEWYRRRRLEPGRIRPGVALSVLAVAIGVSIAGFGGVLVALVMLGICVAALTTRCPVPPWPTDLAAGELAGAAEPTGARPWGGVVDGWRSVVTVFVVVIAAVLAWTFLAHLGHAAVWLVIAGMIAVALDRPVAFLVRRNLRRVPAVATVFVVGASIIAVAGVAGVRGGASTTDELTEELPSIVHDLEDAPIIGSWLRDRDADVWVGQQLEDLPQRIERTEGIGAWLPTVGSRLLDLVWIVLLTAALLVDGPRLRDAMQRRIPARRRRQVTRAVDVSKLAIGGYLAGAALVAGLNATVVFVLAASLGIALAPVLAVWAFVWNFVPQVGGFMGGLPLVALALTVGPAQALVAGGVFIAYQFVENHLIQPAVIGEAIDVPPWATLLTALAGSAAAGVLGAVVLTPLVGVIRVVIAESRRDDFPGNVVPTPPEPVEPVEAVSPRAVAVAPSL
jgi:predicted PurR-regulated permease PerM